MLDDGVAMFTHGSVSASPEKNSQFRCRSLCGKVSFFRDLEGNIKCGFGLPPAFFELAKLRLFFLAQVHGLIVSAISALSTDI